MLTEEAGAGSWGGGLTALAVHSSEGRLATRALVAGANPPAIAHPTLEGVGGGRGGVGKVGEGDGLGEERTTKGNFCVHVCVGGEDMNLTLGRGHRFNIGKGDIDLTFIHLLYIVR